MSKFCFIKTIGMQSVSSGKANPFLEFRNTVYVKSIYCRPMFLHSTCKALNRSVIFPPFVCRVCKTLRIQDRIISMDGIQSVNGNQAESDDIVIAAVPGKVRGAENLYLIYSRVWIYVPALNRKVSDLHPASHKRGPHSIWCWKHLCIKQSSF